MGTVRGREIGLSWEKMSLLGRQSKDRARLLGKASRNKKSQELENCGIIWIGKMSGTADAQVPEVKERKIILRS